MHSRLRPPSLCSTGTAAAQGVLSPHPVSNAQHFRHRRRPRCFAAGHDAPGMRSLQWKEDAVSSSDGRAGNTRAQLMRAHAQQLHDQQQQRQQQQQTQQHQQTRPPGPVRRGLKPDHFRHPLDQQNTRLLKALPGVELVAKSIMGQWGLQGSSLGSPCVRCSVVCLSHSSQCVSDGGAEVQQALQW